MEIILNVFAGMLVLSALIFTACAISSALANRRPNTNEGQPGSLVANLQAEPLPAPDTKVYMNSFR